MYRLGIQAGYGTTADIELLAGLCSVMQPIGQDMQKTEHLGIMDTMSGLLKVRKEPFERYCGRNRYWLALRGE